MPEGEKKLLWKNINSITYKNIIYILQDSHIKTKYQKNNPIIYELELIKTYEIVHFWYIMEQKLIII